MRTTAHVFFSAALPVFAQKQHGGMQSDSILGCLVFIYLYWRASQSGSSGTITLLCCDVRKAGLTNWIKETFFKGRRGSVGNDSNDLWQMPHLPPADSIANTWRALCILMWGCDPSISQAHHQHFTLSNGTLTCPTLYKGFILWFRLDRFCGFWKALVAVPQDELLKALLAPRHFCHKESELCVVQGACTFAIGAQINATVCSYQSAPILYRAWCPIPSASKPSSEPKGNHGIT